MSVDSLIIGNYGRKGRGEGTSDKERDAIISFISLPKYFALISGNVTKDDGKKVKKVNGFALMTEFVNQVAGSNWTVENTQSRYKSLVKKYNVSNCFI